ncbi:MAG: hypothetical protein A4E30_00319 [Methanomassiliicoccales archaeon PtaB.Bin215]|nr:MAG: hypothetical protein A4E30_00319 [Methanomassiliicoccales archaeon PtaB.Bin215]
MADNANIIPKSEFNFYFANEAGEAASHQYDRLGPGKQLEMVVRMLSGNATARQIRQFTAQLPEVMAFAEFDNGGYANIREVHKKDVADFVGPTGGVGASTIKGLGLIPVLAADAIMEGAAPKVCARDCLKKRTMNGPMESMPFFTSAVYLKPSAPGSEAVDIAQDLGMAMLNCKTFRAKATLSKELVKDSVSNIKSDALNEIGKTHEMTINRYCFTQIADFTGTDVGVASSGSDETNAIDAVLRSQSNIADYGFDADTAVLWPRLHKEVFSKLVPMYNPYAMEQVEGVRPLRYGGVSAAPANEIYVGTSAISTAYSFGWGTTSTSKAAASIGGLVFDSTRVGELGILEELEVEEFSDPIKYLECPIANMRWDFKAAKDANRTGRTNTYCASAIYNHS